MLQLTIHGGQANVTSSPVPGEHGQAVPGKVLSVADPVSGIMVTIPFPDEIARELAGMLSGSSVVVAPASAMPRANGKPR